LLGHLSAPSLRLFESRGRCLVVKAHRRRRCYLYGRHCRQVHGSPRTLAAKPN
jgi:hypothetical protein